MKSRYAIRKRWNITLGDHWVVYERMNGTLHKINICESEGEAKSLVEFLREGLEW